MTKHLVQKSGRKGDGQKWYVKIEYEVGDEWITIRTDDGTNTIHEDDLDWLIEELDHMRLKIIGQIIAR